MVSNRWRQNRSIFGAGRNSNYMAAAHQSFYRGWDDHPHALYPALADDSAVSACRPADLRIGTDQTRNAGIGQRTDHNRAVGWGGYKPKFI